MNPKDTKTKTFQRLEDALFHIEKQPYNEWLDNQRYYPYYTDEKPGGRASLTKNKSFTQTSSLEEALQLARNGWEKGSKIVDDLTKRYAEAFIKLFPRQDWTTALQPELSGEIVNMDAVLTGQPETMLHFEEDQEKLKQFQNGKLQRILVNIAYNADINTDTVFNRGSIIASMINTMELAGFRTELWAVDLTMAGGVYFGTNIQAATSRYRYQFRLKNFDEDLNLQKLTFCCCHPAFERRICFALYEQEPEESMVRDYTSKGYGQSNDLLPQEIELFSGGSEGGVLPHGNIYFEMLSYNKNFMTLLNETKTKLEQHFMSIKI